MLASPAPSCMGSSTNGPETASRAVAKMWPLFLGAPQEKQWKKLQGPASLDLLCFPPSTNQAASEF
jgi:hypothetical protein